jgi:hypothetical protein
MVSNPNFGDHSGDHHFDDPSIFAHNLTKQPNIKTTLQHLPTKTFQMGIVQSTLSTLSLSSMLHATLIVLVHRLKRV